MGGGLVGGYVASVDYEQCVCSFGVIPTLHYSSKLFAVRLAPGGALLALNASGD